MNENEKQATCNTIFSQRLAGYLMQKGFVLVDIAPNRRNPENKVFYFKDSPQLDLAINEYATSRKNGKKAG